MSDQGIRNVRHGYYAAISYLDDQVATLVAALDRAGVADNTVVVFISDHGEALGERGLWFKRSFFNVALKVPMIIAAPGAAEGIRCSDNASLVDLLPTLVDMVDCEEGLATIEARHDGRSLRKAIVGQPLDGPNITFAEMAADAMTAPAVAIIENQYKYVHCNTDPPMLFDLATDPRETRNLCGTTKSTEIEARMAAMVREKWDLEALTQDILQSQCRRRLVERAHAQGAQPSWDYDRFIYGRDQYFRAMPSNPSASNYASNYDVRLRPDSERPNRRIYP